MLNANNVKPWLAPVHLGSADKVDIGLTDVFSFVKRNVCLVASLTFVCFLLGGIAAAIAPSQYTAKVQLLIESRRTEPFTQQASSSDVAIENSMIDSQVEVLRSEAVRLNVIEKL